MNKNNVLSADKVKKIEEEQKKLELLIERREKLKELLESEDRLYAEELKEKKKKPVLMEDLNTANIEILIREEEKRRKEKDIKEYHYWKQKQPSLREVSLCCYDKF